MKKSRAEAAAGKLISAIQKEWHEEAGEPTSEESETVMNKAHELLKAAKDGALKELLSSSTVTEYLGESWVTSHPSTRHRINELEESITHEN